jgi:heptosyltransferase-2
MKMRKEKILIIKLSALGDVLRTTVILPGLKKRQPGADIDWMTRLEAIEILSGNPYISELLFIDTVEGRETVARRRYDMILNLEEDIEACILAARLAGASSPRPEIVGFYAEEGTVRPTPTAREWFDMSALGERPRNDELKQANRKTHREIMGEIAGVDVTEVGPILVVSDHAKRRAHEFEEHCRLKATDAVVGLNTGAGGRWERKAWPAGHTIELARRLVAELRVRPILFGGPNEKERNAEIASAVGPDLLDAGTENTIQEFAGLVNLCSLMVVSDSLAVHISTALGKKTIVLIGPTSAAEIDIYGRGAKIVSPVDCVCCYKTRCDREPHCMAAIPVETVFEEVKRWLPIA